MTYKRGNGSIFLLAGLFIFVWSVETIMWDNFEKRLIDKIKAIPSPTIAVTVPLPPKEAQPDPNKVCSTWLFTANLKQAKEQICRK
jgi:hypothetical protein